MSVHPGQTISIHRAGYHLSRERGKMRVSFRGDVDDVVDDVGTYYVSVQAAMSTVGLAAARGDTMTTRRKN